MILGNTLANDSQGDYLVGDISKIKKDIGWEPEEHIFSVIDSMVQRLKDNG